MARKLDGYWSRRCKLSLGWTARLAMAMMVLSGSLYARLSGSSSCCPGPLRNVVGRLVCRLGSGASRRHLPPAERQRRATTTLIRWMQMGWNIACLIACKGRSAGLLTSRRSLSIRRRPLLRSTGRSIAVQGGTTRPTPYGRRIVHLFDRTAATAIVLAITPCFPACPYTERWKNLKPSRRCV